MQNKNTFLCVCGIYSLPGLALCTACTVNTHPIPKRCLHRKPGVWLLCPWSKWLHASLIQHYTSIFPATHIHYWDTLWLSSGTVELPYHTLTLQATMQCNQGWTEERLALNIMSDQHTLKHATTKRELCCPFYLPCSLNMYRVEEG